MAWAMRFDLKSGSTKCITEEIKSSAMTVGKYTVISDIKPTQESHKITIRVPTLFFLRLKFFIFSRVNLSTDLL